MPKMMANWLTETMRPRIRAGLISAMYMGLVIDAAPTPTPPTMRKTMNSVRVRGIAVPMAETRNRIAETTSTPRRPNRSLAMPANAAPSTQPASALLAAQPDHHESSANCVSRNPIAPLMTAVS